LIHRSSIGAIERTFAFLIEHYAGAFPVWIAGAGSGDPGFEQYTEYARK